MRHLIFVVFLAAGCAAGAGGLSEGEILSQAPLANGPVDDRADPAGLTEPEAERRVAEARTAFLRGEYEEAIRVVSETLSARPPRSIEAELKGIRREARRQMVAEVVLSGRVLPVRDVVEMGQPLEADLSLRNQSPREVRISRRFRESSDSVFVLKVEREDWDIFGGTRSFEVSDRLALEADMVLAPGDSESTRFTLPTDPPEQRHLGFTLLTISAQLRPAMMEAGIERFHAPLSLRPATVLLVPPGWEGIAKDPFGTIEKALALGAREHLLVAAELSPPERRQEVIARLVESLERPETEMSVTVMAALRRLTGVAHLRPLEWVAWWKEEGER